MRRRLVKSATAGFVLLLESCAACVAQDWPLWAQELFGGRAGNNEPSLGAGEPETDEPGFKPKPKRPRVGKSDPANGGPRPEISPTTPAQVPFLHRFPAKSIVIDTKARKLYYVLEDNRAYAYFIAVGREGFNWTGAEVISRKQPWPDWRPPAEMRERDPSLPEHMTGGIKNPLGALALYLGDTLYRIHGTNDVKSIGNAQSSGCFRMLNSEVVHLASITPIGTPVVVVSSLPSAQQVSDKPERHITPTALRPLPAIPERHGRVERFENYRTLRDHTLQTEDKESTRQ